LKIAYCTVCGKSNRRRKFYAKQCCTRKCYKNYKLDLYCNIKSLERRIDALENTLRRYDLDAPALKRQIQYLENDRLAKQRSLDRYEECDQNRCRHCGRCSHFIHKGWMDCFVKDGEKCEL